MAATETNSISLDPRLRGDERMRHGASTAKRSVAVIIPTFNEAESIGAVVAGLPRDVVSHVIVVDGGSSDGTRERAKDAGAEVIAVGRGYGLACLTGAQAADDSAAVAALIAPIETGTCDFVIASRARGTREPGSMSWHQLLAGRVIGALIGLLYGARYTDMCALRAIRRDTLLKLGMREMTYGWNLEMQMRTARAHLRVREIPIDYRCRIAGESKVAGSLSGSLKAGAKILSTFARIALERDPLA